MAVRNIFHRGWITIFDVVVIKDFGIPAENNTVSHTFPFSPQNSKRGPEEISPGRRATATSITNPSQQHSSIDRNIRGVAEERILYV
jgi:hypothetical protein